MTWAPSTYFSFVMFFVILTIAVLSEKIHQLNPSLWAVFTIVGLGIVSLIFLSVVLTAKPSVQIKDVNAPEKKEAKAPAQSAPQAPVQKPTATK